MFSSLLHAVSQPSFPQRRYVHVLLKFDGYWRSNCEFSCKEFYEIDIQCGSTFTELLLLSRSTVPSYAKHSEYIISYFANALLNRTFIHDDSTLDSYIRLKFNQCNLHELPLCVELWCNPDSSLNRIPHHDNSLSEHANSSSDDDVLYEEGTSQSSSSAHTSQQQIIVSAAPLLFDTYMSEDELQDNHSVSSDVSMPFTSARSTEMYSEEIAMLRDCKVISRFDPTRIEVNATYQSKKDLIFHLKRLAIANFFQFHTRKSNKSFLHVVCVDNKRCSWAVRAVRLDRNAKIFQVRRYDHEHQCSVDTRQGKTHQATYDVVADLVKHQFHDATKKSYPPKSIMEDMQREHGIYMTYKKAWFAKEKALQLCYDTPEESYASLPSLCFMLNKANPGSLIQLSMTTENVFKYLFISLSAWRDGWPHCVPVLIIDGTFMKFYYKGTLLSAVTRDGNNQIFPLAFGFCDAENTRNWNWFLSKVKLALNHRHVQYIISDRHDGILSAVSSVFPGVSHGHCIYHIFCNIKNNFNGNKKSLSWKFFGVARTTSKAECYRFLKYFDEDDTRIIPYLHAIGVAKWARSFSSNRYSIMTSNLAESMNSVDATPREYPIAKVVDFLLVRLEKWFHERWEIANSMSSNLTKYYESKLNALHASSAVMDVRPASIFEFLVFENDGRSFVVNFQNRTCTCGEFQLDGFVCVHAVAATRQRRGLSCYDYVSPFYTIVELRGAYNGVVHPIPSKDSWVLPDEVTVVQCKPPSCSKRPAGRPKKRRIPSRGEYPKRQLCSRCKSSGHNRKTCTNPLPLNRK